MVYVRYRSHSFACEALEKGPALSPTIRQLQHLTQNIIFEKGSKKKRAILTHLETKKIVEMGDISAFLVWESGRWGQCPT
jgi:hypothetical protein